MPSFRIEGSSVFLSRFDVVGKDGVEARFIDHVGLAETDASFQSHAVAVFDMGPPLRGPGSTNLMCAHAIGCAELTDDELRKIKMFVDQHASEHASFLQLNRGQRWRRAHEIYCIFPHAAPYCEDDDRYVRTRFSCAGFVLEAYNFARITLLEPNDLPMVGMDVLRGGYPAEMQILEAGIIAADTLGLKGAGPWPVLLCGYLFHSLARTADEIREQPYSPTIDDRFFTHEDQEI